MSKEEKKFETIIKGIGENKEYVNGIDKISENCSSLIEKLKHQEK